MSVCFTDPHYLSTYGLFPLSNVLQYFLHPLNPLLPSFPGGATVISCNEELIKRGVVDWDEQLEKLREMKGYQWLVKEIDTTVETGEKAGKRYEEELRVWREKVKDLEESEGTIVKKDGGEEKEEGEEKTIPPPQAPPFHLLPSHSNLFTVTLIYRNSPKSYSVISSYYISQGVIYKCPRVDEVVNGVVGRAGRYLEGVGKELEGNWRARMEGIVEEEEEREAKRTRDTSSSHGVRIHRRFGRVVYRNGVIEEESVEDRGRKGRVLEMFGRRDKKIKEREERIKKEMEEKEEDVNVEEEGVK